MAQSPASADRRANLIREMAKHNIRSRSRMSAGSSSGSEHIPLDLDTESQILPALPAMTPEKAQQAKRQPEFQINTSALRRAFPDFSQYGSSEDGDSIEIGRGLPRNKFALPSEPTSENISLDLGNGERYVVTGTPPVKKRPAKNIQPKSALNNRTTSYKENVDPLAKTTDYVSSASSRGSQPARRSLAEMQPSVDSEDGSSVASDQQKLPSRNTRFNASRTRQPLGESKNSGNAQANAAVDNTANSVKSDGKETFQSFLLPDIPNITELVSGVRQDGTPLFSRSAKPQSRFANLSAGGSKKAKASHATINDVPIPADARALYISLQLLQEKMAGLEAEKDQAVEKADSYELEVLQLKSKLQEQDSALARHADSGVDVDDDGDKTKDWQFERKKFESSIKSLQARLDRANKKVAASETTIKSLTQDRDQAHEQLAVAYVSSEELRNESEAVRDEIESIKSQLAKSTKRSEQRIDKLTRQETELRGKIERREKAVKEMAAIAKEIWNTRSAVNSSDLPATQNARQPLRVEVQTKAPRKTSSTRFTSRPKSMDGEIHVQPSAQGPSLRTNDLTREETYLSFMDGDEVAKLRRILEHDKARLARAEHGLASAVQRKSSMKSLSRRPSGRRVEIEEHDTTQDMTNHTARSRSQSRSRQQTLRDDNAISKEFDLAHDATQQSVASQRSVRRRSGRLEENMTSAFILPDITLTGAALADNAAKALKQTIARPIPVSDREQVQPDMDIEDPTMRPGQEPGIALATVLHSLEEELARLRIQLADQEDKYNQHDPALSQRKRKIVFQRIQRLLATIEARSDQIYALYDVLEGQKVAGQTMDQDEVEVTLQNLGIPVQRSSGDDDGLERARTAEVEKDDEASSASEYEDDEELPWEGIDPTTTHTFGSLPGY